MKSDHLLHLRVWVARRADTHTPTHHTTRVVSSAEERGRNQWNRRRANGKWNTRHERVITRLVCFISNSDIPFWPSRFFTVLPLLFTVDQRVVTLSLVGLPPPRPSPWLPPLPMTTAYRIQTQMIVYQPISITPPHRTTSSNIITIARDVMASNPLRGLLPLLPADHPQTKMPNAKGGPHLLPNVKGTS